MSSSPRFIYDIVVRQEPKHARQCGLSNKGDRRPVDPVPIIQLRILPADAEESERLERDREQHEYISRAGPSTSKTSYRYSPEGQAIAYHDPEPPNPGASFQPNEATGDLDSRIPYYFMYASLAESDTDTEVHFMKDQQTRSTAGSLVSSLYHLKDADHADEHAGFFVFPDISVRREGSYRLKLTLYEVAGTIVQQCKSLFTAPFLVFSPRKFPGMTQSSALTRSLAEQGIKLRIRAEARVSQKRPLVDESEALPEKAESLDSSPTPPHSRPTSYLPSPIDEHENKRSRRNEDSIRSVPYESPTMVQPRQGVETRSWYLPPDVHRSTLNPPDGQFSYAHERTCSQNETRPPHYMDPRYNYHSHEPRPAGYHDAPPLSYPNSSPDHREQLPPLRIEPRGHSSASSVYQPHSAGGYQHSPTAQDAYPPHSAPIGGHYSYSPSTTHHDYDSNRSHSYQERSSHYVPQQQSRPQSSTYERPQSYAQPQSAYPYAPTPGAHTHTHAQRYQSSTQYPPTAQSSHGEFRPPSLQHSPSWGPGNTIPPMESSWSTEARHLGRIELPPLRGPTRETDRSFPR